MQFIQVDPGEQWSNRFYIEFWAWKLISLVRCVIQSNYRCCSYQFRKYRQYVLKVKSSAQTKTHSARDRKRERQHKYFYNSPVRKKLIFHNIYVYFGLTHCGLFHCKINLRIELMSIKFRWNCLVARRLSLFLSHQLHVRARSNERKCTHSHTSSKKLKQFVRSLNAVILIFPVFRCHQRYS